MARNRHQKKQTTGDSVAAYEAMRPQIAQAVEKILERRFIYDSLARNPDTLTSEAQRLFAEERFAAHRFTADEVAFAAQKLNLSNLTRMPDGVELAKAVTAVLRPPPYWAEAARQLFMMLPEFVADGNYQDAWIIYHSANRMVKAAGDFNLFFFEMYRHGLDDWMESTGQNLDSTPLTAEQQSARLAEKTLLLMESDDPGPFVLKEEEIIPWFSALIKQLEPIEEEVRQAYQNGEAEGDINQGLPEPFSDAVGDILLELAQQMAAEVFLPERRNEFFEAVRQYREEMQAAENEDKVQAADGMLLSLEIEEGAPNSTDNMLTALCINALRQALIQASESGDVEIEDE